MKNFVKTEITKKRTTNAPKTLQKPLNGISSGFKANTFSTKRKFSGLYLDGRSASACREMHAKSRRRSN